MCRKSNQSFTSSNETVCCVTRHNPYAAQDTRECACERLFSLKVEVSCPGQLIPFKYPPCDDQPEPQPCADISTPLGRLMFGQLPRGITGKQLLFVIRTVVKIAVGDQAYVDWFYKRIKHGGGYKDVRNGLARVFVNPKAKCALMKLLDKRVVFTAEGFLFAPPGVETSMIKREAAAQKSLNEPWPTWPLTVAEPENDDMQRRPERQGDHLLEQPIKQECVTVYSDTLAATHSTALERSKESHAADEPESTNDGPTYCDNDSNDDNSGAEHPVEPVRIYTCGETLPCMQPEI